MRAAIFDFDGVIANSEPLHFSALRDALLADGIRITEEEYYRLYLAYDDRGAIRLALEHHTSPRDADRVEVIARRKAQIFEERLPTIPFFPGVPELVRALAQEMPLAIASGARRAGDRGDPAPRAPCATRSGPSWGPTTWPGASPIPSPTSPRPLASCRWPRGLRPEECVVFEDSMPGHRRGSRRGDEGGGGDQQLPRGQAGRGPPRGRVARWASTAPTLRGLFAA